MENLMNLFRRVGNLSKDREKDLLAVIKLKKIGSKTILSCPGKVSDKIYFVESGSCRNYYYKDGREVTYWIALEQDFVGSLSSFFMRELNQKYIATIEESILYEFDYDLLHQLFSSSQEWERIGRLFSYYAISLLEKRFEQLHFSNAKEKYEYLLIHRPEIIQRIPLGVIASYLGITQETLSRMRKI